MESIYCDISGICNGRCPYCSRGSGRFPSTGFLSPALYEKILLRLQDLNALPQNKTINLYIWGEPFIHPQINDILGITTQFGLRAHISSNFIHLPDLSPRSLHALSGTTFSLSGFSQVSYSYIHHGRLESTLSNFRRFLDMVNNAGCDWKPKVNWHCYKFNEIEKKAAQFYFQNLGVAFTPTTAHLNDFSDTIDYFVRKTYKKDNASQIEQDLFTEFIAEVLRRGQHPDYICRWWSNLAFDAQANVLLCCAAPSDGMENQGILGSFFDVTLEEIDHIHKISPDCKICRAGGLAKVPETQNKVYSITQYLQDNPYCPSLEDINRRVSVYHSQNHRRSNKDNLPLVSIGMATYNAESFIRASIEAALAQDYPNIEICITDDASTDKTGDICQEYASKDNRIRYYRNTPNIGARLNILRAFELCRGEYFIWTADHDLWHPEYVTTLLPTLLDDPDVVLCYPQTVLIDSQGVPIKLMENDEIDTRGLSVFERFKKMLWELAVCNMFHALYRSNALRKVRSYGKVVGSDHVVLTEINLYGSIAQIKEPLYYRRQNRSPETYQQRIERTKNTLDPSAGPKFEWIAPYCVWGHEHLQIIYNSGLPPDTQEQLALEIHTCFTNRWKQFIDQEIDHIINHLEQYRLPAGQFYMSRVYDVELLNIVNVAKFFCTDPNKLKQLNQLQDDLKQPFSSRPSGHNLMSTVPRNSSEVLNIFQRGIELLKSDNAAEAVNIFNALLNVDATLPNVHYARAVGLLTLGRKNEALQDLQKEMIINPNHHQVQNLREQILSSLSAEMDLTFLNYLPGSG